MIHKLHELYMYEMLKNREETFRLRTLKEYKSIELPFIEKENQRLLNFSSNDYLGLSEHPYILEKSKEYIDCFGSGAKASRLVTGSFSYHREVEEKLKKISGYESVLLFNSGYIANSSIFSSFNDAVILCDQRVHRSTIEGIKGKKFKRFRHNDIKHLEELLNETSGMKVIITESLFSVDGDFSDLKVISELSEKYKAFLYIDEAHTFGLFGENGFGRSYGLKSVDCVMGTFGKAAGSYGAFIASSKLFCDYLINFCPGLIYTTALPPSIIGAISASLDLIPNMEKERSDLQIRSEFLRSELKALGYSIGNSSAHIIPIILSQESEVLKLSSFLESEGIVVSALRPPTTALSESCIRISLTAKHTDEHVYILLKALKKSKSLVARLLH